MEPACLNCGAVFEGSQISRKRRFALCAHCGSLHNVSSFYSAHAAEDLRVDELPATIHFGESLQSRLESNRTE